MTSWYLKDRIVKSRSSDLDTLLCSDDYSVATVNPLLQFDDYESFLLHFGARVMFPGSAYP